WALHRGPIPPGQYVCHRCDTPSCVNPDHLFLATQKQNLEDMTLKGRRSHKGPPPDRSYRTKLTWDAARKIRNSKSSAAELARQFGITKATIYKIRWGDIWKETVSC